MNSRLKKMLFGSKSDKVITLIILIIFLTPAIIISINIGIHITTILLLIILFLILNIIIDLKEKKQFFNRLDKKKLKMIEKELQYPLAICKHHYVLTDSFIIKLNNKCAVLNYYDILLIYKKTKVRLSKNSSIDRYLVLITKDNKYEFIISTTLITLNYQPIDFMNIIKSKNPNVLVNITNDNIKIMKEKYNLNIKK